MRLMLSNPSAPLLAPHRPEHQVWPPGVSGGTRAASWAEDLVEREGVVLLSGPLSADSQEVLTELGTGRSSSRILPLPAAGPPALSDVGFAVSPDGTMRWFQVC